MTASAVTTHHCVEADLTMNERALARLHKPEAKSQRYRAPDSLIDLLKTLRLCEGRSSRLALTISVWRTFRPVIFHNHEALHNRPKRSFPRVEKMGHGSSPGRGAIPVRVKALQRGNRSGLTRRRFWRANCGLASDHNLRSIDKASALA